MRRWARRIGLALLALLAAVTLAAFVYDQTSAGGVAARTLYAGPYVDVDGRSLAYRRWGAHGTPIVLVGGFVEASWVWQAVGPLLGRVHRVYALDLPPFGYSERRGPYTLAQWLEELRGFERVLGIRRPTVVGHSLGAAVAVGAALRAPRSVRSIVLLDGDALREGGGPGWVTHLAVDPYYTALYRLVTSSDWIFRRALRGAYAGRGPALDDAELERWQRPFRVAGTAAAFRSMLRYGIQGWTLADLRRVHVRRAVVWGADDTVDSVSSGREAARALGVPLELVPDAGHLSMLVQPRRVAALIARAAR